MACSPSSLSFSWTGSSDRIWEVETCPAFLTERMRIIPLRLFSGEGVGRNAPAVSSLDPPRDSAFISEWCV